MLFSPEESTAMLFSESEKCRIGFSLEKARKSISLKLVNLLCNLLRGYIEAQYDFGDNSEEPKASVLVQKKLEKRERPVSRKNIPALAEQYVCMMEGHFDNKDSEGKYRFESCRFVVEGNRRFLLVTGIFCMNSDAQLSLDRQVEKKIPLSNDGHVVQKGYLDKILEIQSLVMEYLEKI